MEVLACTTRKNKLIHASASRLGPEKLVLSWVRTILNSRMKMVKFCREFMQYALVALGDEFTCLVSVQKMSYCQKFCFLFVCLLRSVAYSSKLPISVSVKVVYLSWQVWPMQYELTLSKSFSNFDLSMYFRAFYLINV